MARIYIYILLFFFCVFFLFGAPFGLRTVFLGLTYLWYVFSRSGFMNECEDIGLISIHLACLL